MNTPVLTALVTMSIFFSAFLIFAAFGISMFSEMFLIGFHNSKITKYESNKKQKKQQENKMQSKNKSKIMIQKRDNKQTKKNKNRRAT